MAANVILYSYLVNSEKLSLSPTHAVTHEMSQVVIKTVK